MTQGEAIVTAAREWMGTRFHHQGRKKKQGSAPGGVDCLGLLVGVARELNLVSPQGALLAEADVQDYGHIPDGKKLQATLGTLMQEVTGSAMQAGDVLLMRFEREPQHLAIVSDHPQGGLGIIHAYAAARKVVEQRLDALWKSRVISIYRILT